MNYWLLTSEYPPFFGGGISTYCYHTAKMLTAHGHTVTVFINDASVKDYQIDIQPECRLVRFSTSRTKSSSFLGHTTAISYEFASIINHFVNSEGAPDIIESQEYLGIAYYLLQYKRLLYDWCKDIPVVITMHSPSFLYMEYNHVSQYRYPNFWICEMERFCLQAANHIFSPSQFMIEELEKRFKLSHKKITVIPNPYEVGKEVALSEQQDGEIVFFGKLTVQKGAFNLLGYFKKLWDDGFNKSLTIIGGQDIIYQPEDLSMGDWIKKHYAIYISRGLLKLEGRIPPSAISERVLKASVVLVPSMNDNFPYVVLEMMAFGKIVLASFQGGQREVIEDGIDGFIFDHKNPETFADKLYQVLALTKEARIQIREKAIHKVSKKYNYTTIGYQKTTQLETIKKAKNFSETLFPYVRPLLASHQQSENNIDVNKLSIIVPYYNMGNYIDETIQSILQSDYIEKEIIIVNDGSTDEPSIKQLEKYKAYTEITIINTPNKGLGAARNKGASVAKGKLIAFLDADDTIEKTYYSKAVRVLNHYTNIHFCGTWVQYFDKSERIWPAFSPEPPLVLYHNMVNSSSLVFKKESFLAIGGNDTAMLFQGLEDYEAVVACLSNGLGGIVLPEALFHYRIRKNSMIRNINKTKKLLLHQHISEKHSQLFANHASVLSNLLNANGPGISIDNPSLDYYLTEKMPFGGKLSARLVGMVKQNKFIRPIAYKLYRWFKR